MVKKRRNAADKLNTLFFGKDLRITEGEPYTEVRDFDFSSYYPLDDYISDMPLPGENVYDIRSFGAACDCGDNAEFVNKAIENAAKTAGTVLVDGGDYVCSTVILKSNVTLFIARGSSISANRSGKGYEKHKAIVYADGCENITLTGGGSINGMGNFFGRKPALPANVTEPAEYIDVIEMRKSYRAQLRFAHESKYGGPVSLHNCKGITVKNLVIENSAYWTFKLVNCRNIKISDFVINNNRNVANADGIDIAGCDNIEINHCFISTADDGIVIKNAIWLGNRGDMSNIKITGCEVISRTNAIKVGTETTYDISNIRISDCRLFMTDLYPGSVSGISLEACDGTVLSNVNIENIVMDRCTCPVFIRVGNRNRASAVNAQSANAVEFGAKAQKGGETGKKLFDGASRITDIRISNVKATGAELPVIIAGYRQRGRVNRVQNITLEDFDIEYAPIPETVDRRMFIPEYTKVYPECWRFRNLPAYALWTRHTENVKLKNFVCRHPLKTWKKDIVQIDSA